MFFGEEEIATNLICPRCKTKFVDPRIIVPCCETLCFGCIEDLTITDKKDQISCHFCLTNHAVPKDGFASNKLIAQMLSLRANEVYRGANMEKFKQKLARIETLTDEFKSKLENSTLIINEYCRDVKTQMDLLVETKKKELDDMREEFVTRIDTYEQECVSNLQQLDTQIFLDRVDQANKFASEWKSYLKNFKIDEEVVSEPSRQVDGHVASLEKLLKELKGAQFNGRLLSFKASESKTDPIGTIEFETLEVLKDSQIKELSKFNFRI
jgi:hypothetical protein